MNSNVWGISAIIVCYLVGMVAIGIYFMKKNSSTGDYYLGGRQLGPIVTAMSAEASDMSSWLLMGLPGVAYLTGTADAAWTAIGLAIGTYLNWLIVAKRLRRYSVVAGHAITLPQFFAIMIKVEFWQDCQQFLLLSFLFHIQHPVLRHAENYFLPCLEFLILEQCWSVQL